MVFAGSFWSFADSLYLFAGGLCSFAGGLCSFVVVACFSNDDFKTLDSNESKNHYRQL